MKRPARGFSRLPWRRRLHEASGSAAWRPSGRTAPPTSAPRGFAAPAPRGCSGREKARESSRFAPAVCFFGRSGQVRCYREGLKNPVGYPTGTQLRPYLGHLTSLGWWCGCSVPFMTGAPPGKMGRQVLPRSFSPKSPKPLDVLCDFFLPSDSSHHQYINLHDRRTIVI